MHVHTLETSSCGMVPASELVRLYNSVGYDGIVITDHYYKDYFDYLGRISWDEKVDMFLKGYRNARSEGEKVGLNVILGIELRFNQNNNDYLIFGIDETFLKENTELYNLDLVKFRELVRHNDILIYQAHPFRSWVTPADPDLLDRIEVFNGNPRQDNNNHQALAFAKNNNLRMISGSDFHQPQDLAMGGIILLQTCCLILIPFSLMWDAMRRLNLARGKVWKSLEQSIGIFNNLKKQYDKIIEDIKLEEYIRHVKKSNENT